MNDKASWNALVAEIERLNSQLATRDALIKRLIEAGASLRHSTYMARLPDVSNQKINNAGAMALAKGDEMSEMKSIDGAEVHWDCKIAQLEAELKITDELLKEATETIGAVVACCTYNSNDDAKIGIYGIDQKAFTRIDQFITHYNDAVSAGKVSVDIKKDLSDAEIEELGAQEAEKRDKK